MLAVPSFTGRRIPSLDGLRALAIVLVIGAHLRPSIHGLHLVEATLSFICADGYLGVAIFFVLSGFLITSLLLRELDRSKTISLKAFYRRRAYRILPAFGCYMIVIALLYACKSLTVSRSDFVTSFFFLRDYVTPKSPDGWYVTHLWSLSVEDQFYLLWPVTMLLCKRRHAAVAAGIVLAATPVLRLLTWWLTPSVRYMIPYMLHTNADYMMFGALAAIVRQSAPVNWWMRVLGRFRGEWLLIIFLFIVSPLLIFRFRAAYAITIGTSLSAFVIASLVLFVTTFPMKPFVRLLNTKPAVSIGLVSYSLYLWQEIFLPHTHRFWCDRFPINLVFAVAAAICSYFFIERPFLLYRNRRQGFERNRLNSATSL